MRKNRTSGGRGGGKKGDLQERLFLLPPSSLLPPPFRFSHSAYKNHLLSSTHHGLQELDTAMALLKSALGSHCMLRRCLPHRDHLVLLGLDNLPD